MSWLTHPPRATFEKLATEQRAVLHAIEAKRRRTPAELELMKHLKRSLSWVDAVLKETE